MKAVDIVAQLAAKLPKLSDKFTTNISVTSLTNVGVTATADTATAHGLVIGDSVNITGAESPITINSLTRAGVVGTLVTATPHDLTEETSGTVDISGAVEAEFSGIFTILTVIDRNTVTFTMTDAGAVVATGTPQLLNGFSIYQGYNGLFAVASAPTTTQFTYTLITTPPLTTATGTIIARTAPRISSGISQDRCLEAYTTQAGDNLWAYVILGDVVASKSRKIDSDAVANLQTGEDYRQQLIQPFMVMVVIPTVTEIAGRVARDLAEDLFPPICKSLLLSKFDSGLRVGSQNPVAFVDHGFAAYNTAFYVHTYAFEQVADLTFDDTVGYPDNVAFRDIDTNIFLDPGTGENTIEANVNLDG